MLDPKSVAGESSPFDDGELYDILFKDFTYGIDFMSAWLGKRQDRFWTSPAGRAGFSCRACRPEPTWTDWTSTKAC